MKAKTRQIFILLICALTASCQKSCSKPAEITMLETSKNQQEEASAVKPLVAISHLNFDGLSQAQINSITKLFNEEICPCGCPTTFAQCLNMKEGCKPAMILAEWAIKQIKEGAPEHFLYRAISEEINTGYLAQEKIIDTLHAYQKGNANAAVTIVEFADFECPGCKLAAAEMKTFINDNIADVKIFFMHFPLSTHQNAERAAIAAEAAGKQGKFWEMHDKLFAHNGPLTDLAIKDLAKTLFTEQGLRQFEKDLADPAIVLKIKEHKEYGLNVLNLVGTPTFMFNGRPYNLSSAKDGYQARLAMEKARKDIKCGAPQ